MYNTNFKNKLLISTKFIRDPIFKKSVIYIYEHNEKEINGLIINKKIQELTINNIIRNKENLNKKYINKPIFFGGPLSCYKSFILHNYNKKFDFSIKISNKIMINKSLEKLYKIGDNNFNPKNILVTLGYSSWDISKIEEEIKNNFWIISDSYNSIIFNYNIDKWNESIKKTKININNILNLCGNA